MGRHSTLCRGAALPASEHPERSLRASARIQVSVVALTVLISLWLGAGAGAQGASHEKVISSDDSAVRFSLSDLQPRWTERSLRSGSLVLSEVRVDGFANTGVPTQPELPVRSGWILVPAGRRPVLQVVQEEWQASEPVRLMIAATPVLYQNPETGEVITSHEVLLPGESPPPGGIVPQEYLDQAAAFRSAGSGQPAVSVGEAVRWRGRHIAPYTIRPVQSDGQGRAARWLKGGTWEIRFVADPAANKRDSGAAGRPKRTTQGDEHFSGHFLNGEQMSRWPLSDQGEAAARTKALAPGWGDRAGRPKGGVQLVPGEIRVPVEKTRVHRVAASRVLAAGLWDGALVQEDQIRLYQRRYLPELDGLPGRRPYVEIEVPIRVFGDGGAFSGDDFFLFYGLRPRDDLSYGADFGDGPVTVPSCGDTNEINNTNNIYWLTAAEPPAGEAWARIASGTLAAAVGPPLSGYRRVEYVEEDNNFQANVPEEDWDRNRWNSHLDSDVAVHVPIYGANPAGSPARLRAELIGFSQSPAARIVEVYLKVGDQETFLGTVDVRGLQQYVFEADLDPALLSAQTVQVRFQRPGGSGRLFCFVDWVELSYDAFYAARANQLPGLHGGDELGPRDIEVTGFTTDDLGLIDVTDPRGPVWIDLAPGNLVDAGGSTTLSIQVPQTSQRANLIVQADMDGSGVPEIFYPEASLADPDADPTAAVAPPDLLVITHGEFREAIGRWIDHRQAREGGDLSVHVADIDQLFDWYTGGMKDAWAIRRLTEHAMAEWGTWALQLVGDANENVRGLGSYQPSPIWYNAPTDWVPTHFHVQDLSAFNPELLMSDKWFAAVSVSDIFPDDFTAPTQMYVGRFPVNTVADLNIMIDKTILFETYQPGQDWRRRAVFIADDAWKQLDWDLSKERYYSYETAFEISENLLANRWETLGELGNVAARFLLSEHMPYTHPDSLRGTTQARIDCETIAVPELRAEMNLGATLVHYQGHGNRIVLTHEFLLQDEYNDRRDVTALSNAGRPWIFFGMGCHISDWAENTALGTAVVEPAAGEKLLAFPNGGAVASYASSGFEYLIPNRALSEIMMEIWFLNPPTSSLTGPMRSRWMLGELMWAAEVATLDFGPTNDYRRMIAQYSLLGDALMMLDCGPPKVTVTLTDAGGEELEDDDELVALDATNLRSVLLQCADEAGVDRVELHDSEGNDLTGEITITETLPPDAGDHQFVDFALELPLRPFDHELILHVYDTSDRLPTDDHFQRTVKVPMTVVFYLDGEPLEPGSVEFLPDVPLSFTARVTSGAWITQGPDEIELRGQNLVISSPTIEVHDGRLIDLGFTATALGGSSGTRAVTLAIGPYETTFELQGQSPPIGEAGILDLYAFPSPMSDATRFLFRTGAPPASGKILIYSTAGRTVAALPIEPRHFSDGSAVIAWDGTDGNGDELANGVYLYRVQLQGPQGRLESDMQRLVVMR